MKKHILFGICALSLLFNACNDDFLEYAPITNPTEETAFVSYENFKTYSWGLYDIFSNGLMRQNVSGSTTSLSMVIYWPIIYIMRRVQTFKTMLGNGTTSLQPPTTTAVGILHTSAA